MKKLIIIILILMFLPVSINAAENQSIIFGGSYSIDNITNDADSAWLYIFNNAILVDSSKVTAKDLQWNGCYQYVHTCTNDSTDGWTGWWVYFGESETVQISEWAIVATARDSSIPDQIFGGDITTRNIYGTFGAAILSLANVQALALAPASHEQTTTRIALNLTATTDDLFNGCLLNCRSGDNEGFTTRITDYEAYSGDSGVVIVSPPLVVAATENQLFVITSADHAEGDTNQFTVEDIGDTVRVIVNDSIPALFDSLLLKARHAQVDSLKDTVEDMSTRLLATGFSTLTDNDIRIALGDTLYNSRTDSILAVLATVAGNVLDIAYYWGACDGCYYRLYPESGTSNKDSAIIIDPSLGVDSMVAKVVYLHGTDVQVVDTVYFYRDEPW